MHPPRHLLIVDDSPSDHTLIEELLGQTKEKYHFSHAYEVESGLRAAVDPRIDCILLDYMMPGQTGLEALQQFANLARPIPIIMMTGEGNEYIAVTAMKLGSQDYIPKGALSPAALQRAIGRAIEHQTMLDKMERYRADLERSNRDLEQFATIVAHDLKSPLRAISQHLSLIESRQSAQLDEKSKRSLHFALDGADRLRQLIDGLFDYARLGFTEPMMERVSLETLLHYTLRDLSTVLAERGTELTHDALPEVMGDPLLLTQLLQNLIANAVKYCKQTPRIHISAARDGNQWRISVQDNGIGIPLAAQQKIFTIFRRLHAENEYPGIGLGLAICERIVKQHHGKISVASTPSAGSCFHFTLPDGLPIVSSAPAVKEVMYL